MGDTPAYKAKTPSSVGKESGRKAKATRITEGEFQETVSPVPRQHGEAGESILQHTRSSGVLIQLGLPRLPLQCTRAPALH
jgi:hypothetical protein